MTWINVCCAGTYTLDATSDTHHQLPPSNPPSPLSPLLCRLSFAGMSESFATPLQLLRQQYHRLDRRIPR